MKQEFTLAKTWQLCLRASKWFAEETRKREGKKCCPVSTLKERWMKKHDYSQINSNCFFCHYAAIEATRTKSTGSRCVFCPGIQIDKDFSCCTRASYHYANEPIEFHKKIVQLNKKRLTKNRSTK